MSKTDPFDGLPVHSPLRKRQAQVQQDQLHRAKWGEAAAYCSPKPVDALSMQRELDRVNRLLNHERGKISMNNINMFDNGMAPEEEIAVEDLSCEIATIILHIEDLPRHRSYALAITKLDEARHWLRDRKHRPAQ
jgi:hypothetical protein